MIYIVTCEQNKKIQLPCGVSPTVGSSLPCPSECPNRKRCSAHISNFRVSGGTVDDGRLSPYGGLIRYTASELQDQWRDTKLQTFPDFDSVVVIANEDMRLLEELKPVGKHKQIMVNMKVFSDDPDVRYRIPLSRPLDAAMKEIFSFWYTNAVFKNDSELNDSFVWLMTKQAKAPIFKAEVDTILKNPEYNRSQKFFHLFYDVIYKNGHPGGFYWCDSNSAYDPLRPKFGNKKDFIKFFMSEGGEGFEFYKNRKQEVLSYLEVEDERELMAEIICEQARSSDEVVWIDVEGAKSVRRFGSKSSFLQNMYRPTDYATMKDMIGFLENYQVSSFGVTPRPRDIPFERVGGECSLDESLIYDVVGLQRQDYNKRAYEAFLSLLGEYVGSNAPKNLRVGPMNLGDNYQQECEKYVFNYCSDLLIGDVNDNAKLNQGKKQAILAASLLERGVFGSYNTKNSETVRNLIKKVLTLNPGSAECNMNWYIGKYKTDSAVEFVKKIEGDRLIEEWFKRSAGNAESKVNSSIAKYNELYRQFEKKC